MSDPTEQILPRPRRTELWQWGLFALAGVLALAVVFLVARDHERGSQISGLQHGQSVAQSVASANRAALASANAKLASLGVAPVPPGPTGPPGLAGRGIVAAVVSPGGHLLLSYSDGSTADVGRVVGPRGEQGPRGSRGVAGKTGKSGRPGENGETGAQGPAGRGIASTEISESGHLIVTYTDGTSTDLGPVIGPQGVQGEPGPAGPSGQPGFPPGPFTFTIPGAGGIGDTDYVCTPDGPAGPGDQPHYTCQPQDTGGPP